MTWGAPGSPDLMNKEATRGCGWLSQDSGSCPPRNGCLPKRGCLVLYPLWFSHLLSVPFQNSTSVCSAQCGGGGQSLPDSGAHLYRCAFCCLSQTKHQEKPKGGFGIKCPPGWCEQEALKVPRGVGLPKRQLSRGGGPEKTGQLLHPACQDRKGPQASSGCAVPLCRRGGRFVGGSHQGQRRGEEAAPASVEAAWLPDSGWTFPLPLSLPPQPNQSETSNTD